MLWDKYKIRSCVQSATQLDAPLSDKISTFLIDQIGQLKLYYALCGVTFLGGSFYPSVGGHNPFEGKSLKALI